MKTKGNSIIVKITLLTILLILLLNIYHKYDVLAVISGSKGVGYPDSLKGNFCCQEDTALWSPDIEDVFKTWYWGDEELPYKEIKQTTDLEVSEELAKKLNEIFNGTSSATTETIEKTDDDVDDVVEWAEELLEGANSIPETPDSPGEITAESGTITIIKTETFSYDKEIYGAKLGEFTEQDHGWGDAAETYIANHSGGYFDGGEPSPGQKLWWQTSVGQGGSGTTNVDDATVNEWEDYIKDVTGEDNPKSSENGFNTEDKYNPSWNTDGIYENPKAVYNASTDEPYYIIGPFSIDYIDGGSFAFIKDFRVYTDEDLNPVSCEIVACDNIKDIEGEDGNTYDKYPAPNTTFYIKLNAKDLKNATKITDIQVDFKFWDGSVEYYRYDSDDGYTTMRIQPKGEYEKTIKWDIYKWILFGTKPEVSKKFTLTLEVVETHIEDAQSIAEVTPKWWSNETTLDRKSSSNKATIQVEKIIEAKGTNGEILSLADLGLDENSCPSFDFKIEVDGNQSEIISVKPGSTATSKVYEWTGSAPKFTVTECDNSTAREKLRALGYEIGDIQLKYPTSSGGGSWNASEKRFEGTLPSEGNLITLSNNNQTPSTTIHLTAKNYKVPNEGNLEIVKKFKEYGSSNDNNNRNLYKALNDKVTEIKNNNNYKFKFDVEIYGNFEYNENGSWVKCRVGDSENSDVYYKRQVILSKDNDFKWSNCPQIKWYGEEVPRFKVTELPDETGVTKIESISPQNGNDKNVSSGKLAKGNTVTITATNGINYENGKLKIIKKVKFDNSHLPNDEEIKEKAKRIYKKRLSEHSFKFKLNVENYYGYDTGNNPQYFEISGATGEWRKEADGIEYYVIEHEIDQVFVWVKGNDGLRYSITELKEDERNNITIFESCDSDYDKYKIIDNDNKTISGRLKAGDNGTVGIINNTFINKSIDPNQNVELDIFKIINSLSETELESREFKFKVTLEGAIFKYGENWYSGDVTQDGTTQNVKILLTNSSEKEETNIIDGENPVITITINNDNLFGSWKSKEISWVTIVDSPHYTIEEDTTGTNFEDTITNNKGSVASFHNKQEILNEINTTIEKLGNTEENTFNDRYKKLLENYRDYINGKDVLNCIYLLAENNSDEVNEGKIAIIKKLEGAEYLSPNYIRGLEFKFNIKIGNQISFNQILKYSPDEDTNNLYTIGNNYYWIYVYDRNRITWGENEDAPRYSVEEIDTGGTKFKEVYALNDNNVIINDQIIEGTVSTELVGKNIINDLLNNSSQDIEDRLIDVTNLVCYTNKIGPDKISLTKKIEGTESELRDLVGKDYKFQVKVEGKFTYNNTDYNGTYYFKTDKTISTNQNERVIIKVEEGHIDAVWDSAEIVYDGDAPKITITETDIPDGIECKENSQEGVLGSKNDFTFINTKNAKKAKLKLIKYLDNEEAKLSENQINSLSFKFKINIEEQNEYKNKEITIGPGYSGIDADGRYYWQYPSDGSFIECIWYGKDSINYTIEETDSGSMTEFISSSINGNKKDTKRIQGTLTQDGIEIKEFKNEFTNKAVIKDYANLTLIKKVENFSGNETYSFKVKVKGKFKIGDTEYDTNGAWYTFNTEKELINNESGKVSINVTNGRSSEWKMPKIELINGIPEYEVEEIIPAGAQYTAKIENSKGYLSGDVKASITNTYNSDSSIKIIKNVNGISNLSEEEKNNLCFKFKVKIGDNEEQVITISRANGKWEWIQSVQNNNQSFRIEEIGTYNTSGQAITDIQFSSASTNIEGASVNGKVITGTLSDGENKFTYNNTKGTKIEPKNGGLKIEKNIANSSLQGKDFYFKVTIKGTFSYNGKQYGELHDDKYYTNDNIKVAGGSDYIINNITWYGDGPTYTVEELDSPNGNPIAGRVWTDTLTDNNTLGNTVIAINEEKETGGYLRIHKSIDGGSLTSGNEKYTFRVKIGNNEPYTVEIGPGEVWTSERITWDVNDEKGPQYIVEEINLPYGSKLSEIKNKDGNLTDNNGKNTTDVIEKSTVTVECENTINKHQGKFKVLKKIAKNPKGGLANAKNKEFNVKIVISGTFTVKEKNKTIVNGTYIYQTKIKENGDGFISDTIEWYGNNNPTVHVSEELDLGEDGADIGWKLLGISNNESQIKDGNSTVITITNELPEETMIDLTLELAGKVWEDEKTDIKGSASEEDGIYGKNIDDDSKSEPLIEGVEVYVYKKYNNGNRELATIYDNYEGAVISQPIVTDKTGHWDAPRVKITDEGYLKDYSFDIEFVYDGQTYEPTKFLRVSKGDFANLNKDKYAISNIKSTNSNLEPFDNYQQSTNVEKANIFKNATTGRRDCFQFSSTALDVNRQEVNNRINEVKGYTAIDGNGNTTGIAVTTPDKGKQENFIYYKAQNPGKEGSRTISKLQTLNSDGTALDLFKATARTSMGDLTYMFDDIFVIYSSDVKIGESGMNTHLSARATYNYGLNINLGLTRREEADLQVQKDLESAYITVNNKVKKYTFNQLTNIKGNIRAEIDSQKIEYKLGLYKTDYYYRAEMYKTSVDYDKIQNYYSKYLGTLDDTNLEIYLNYKIKLYNASSNKYMAIINSVEDYYDGSLELVTNDVKRFNNENEETVIVGRKAYYKSPGGQTSNINDVKIECTNIKSSNGLKYNKISLSGLNASLASGAIGEIHITLKADASSLKEAKEKIENQLKEKIENGEKSNIVEIANYSIYSSNGKDVAGKIDRDSAPSNIDIISRNEKSWYEEDTDSAPKITLEFKEPKTVSGLVWDDNSNSKDKNGNNLILGKYDKGKEALIGGLTTELVQKIKIKDNDKNIYTDYDFIWPTNTRLDSLNGRTLEEASGFSSIVETSRENKNENGETKSVGEYKFEGVPTGEYVVRFLYGNNKLSLENTSKITIDKSLNTIDPVAYKSDGNIFNDNSSILTPNYDEESLGNTPAVYNGHDYKSTIYQKGYDNLDKEYYEITNGVSDAKDSEARRLEVIANSETITNVNGTVLASANNRSLSHDDLYDSYYMYADTAKLVIDYEGNSNNNVNNNSVNNIKNIDFGLTERPKNTIILDKEISEIKIITNDGNVIFDALYNTNYYVKSNTNGFDIKLAKRGDKYLVAKTTLDKDNSVQADILQAINKVEDKLGNSAENIKNSKQNFRYINIEDKILQGTTIKIKYNFYAINFGEKDYTGEKLATIKNEAGNEVFKSSEIKKIILGYAKDIYTENYQSTNKIIVANTGKYLGNYYYTGIEPNTDTKRQNMLVKTKVRQLVDYVDNDAVFSSEYNSDKNNSWKPTTITELSGNGYDENRLLRKDILYKFEILDSSGENYLAENNNNIILSIDSQENNNNNLNNNDFEKKLKPCESTVDENNISTIGFTITKTVSAEDDSDNLEYENLAEIVKFENSVGRRNITATPGNSNPSLGVWNEGIKEIDSSSTELITFIPPTGIETENILQTQILIAVIIGMIVLVGGIVIIKKKVLK